MKVAVLTNEVYKAGTTLEEDELKLLWSVLRLYRSEDRKARAILEAIDFCSNTEPSKIGASDVYDVFFRALMNEFDPEGDEVLGIIAARGVKGRPAPETVTPISDERELRSLRALQTILRKGGWFAEWLQAELRFREDKKVTPLEVIDSLTEPAANFEYEIEDAKRMLADWPELVQPEAAADEAPALEADTPKTGVSAEERDQILADVIKAATAARQTISAQTARAGA
jgi:hypothetical protein